MVQEKHVEPIILKRSFLGGKGGGYIYFLSRESNFQGVSGSVQVVCGWGKTVA